MLYRYLSSLKTSVYILCFLCIIFLIGTIFPQGGDIEDYIEAGGKYVAVVRALDFLDLFGSPLFFAVIAVLLANLAFCLYDRLKLYIKIRRRPMDFHALRDHPNVVSFKSNEIGERLEKIGFTVKAEAPNGAQPGVKIYEKGLQYWWLSWCYHVGIILAIFGFFLTYLFAFEKYVVLYPGKSENISLYSKKTRWNEFLDTIGVKVPDEKTEYEYSLTLKEFRTEYYQGLKIDYPKEKLERLAIGIGVKKLEPSEKGFSFMPKMWLTRLDVRGPDGTVSDAQLWVNKPFRTGSLTLYQMGYEQKMSILVIPVEKRISQKLSERGESEMLDVEARVPFQIEDMKGKFVLGTLKTGTLYKRDRSKEEIKPVTTLYYIPGEDPSAREVIGDISLGGQIETKGITLEFRNYNEGSYLSYRKDPGVWLVGIACLFVFIGLFVRSLGAWYRIQYASAERITYILVSTRGILADKDRILKKLVQ